MRQSITREVKDAILDIGTASDRVEVAEKAIESAREALRVERLKYETGSGTTPTCSMHRQHCSGRKRIIFRRGMTERPASRRCERPWGRRPGRRS